MKTLTLTLIMFSSSIFAQTFQRMRDSSSESKSKKSVKESLEHLTESPASEEGVFVFKVQDLDLIGIKNGQIVFLDVQNELQGFYSWDEENYKWNKITDPSKIYSDSALTRLYFN